MKTFELTVDSAPVGERSPAFPAVDYTADMLQCTTPPDDSPDRFDYLAVARIARDMRNEYIASLLSRAKNALADRFAPRGPATRSPAR